MASWREVCEQAPELAAVVRERFAVRKHATMATLRRDGSPRISGTEVTFTDDAVTIGSMGGAMKARDLQRDARLMLHSPTVDPPEEQPSAWPGEAKIAGRAVEEPNSTAIEGAHQFQVDVDELVFTRVVGEELEVRWWCEGRGEQVRRRR